MPAFFAVILLAATLAAAEPLPDGAMLADMYSECLRELVPAPSDDSLRTVSVSFEGPVRTSAAVHTRTEAILTALGYTIAEPGGDHGISVTITVTEARIAVRRGRGGMGRYFALSVHVSGTGRSGATVFSRAKDVTRSDVIAASSTRATDTAFDFSYSIARTDAGGRPGRIMTVSFLMIASALGWFAFQ